MDFNINIQSEIGFYFVMYDILSTNVLFSVCIELCDYSKCNRWHMRHSLYIYNTWGINSWLIVIINSITIIYCCLLILFVIQDYDDNDDDDDDDGHDDCDVIIRMQPCM